MATGLSTGQYTGTINFTDSLNNTAAVTVTLSVNGGTATGLTVTPSSLTFSTAVGGAQQVNNLSVTSTSGGTSSHECLDELDRGHGEHWHLASNTQGTVTVTVTPGAWRQERIPAR